MATLRPIPLGCTTQPVLRESTFILAMEIIVTFPLKMSRPCSIVLLFMVNITLSITIVLLNKTIYTKYGYPNLTMTCIHFAFTTLGLAVCTRLGIFKAKYSPVQDTVAISLAFCGFVILNNLSLQYNTVGTCTTIKCLVMPCIAFIQTYFYDRQFALRIKLTLIPIITGAVLNSNFDLKFSVIGVLFGLSGVIASSLYQVWIGEKQKELGMTAMQLLYHQAPMSVVTVSVLGLSSEAFSTRQLKETWAPEVFLLVLLSGLIAFGLNISIYLIIGTTSALTYNMVGHTKLILTLIGGYLLFNEPVQPIQFAGVTFTVAGVVLYTFLKTREKPPEQDLKIYDSSLKRVEKGAMPEKSSSVLINNNHLKIPEDLNHEYLVKEKE